MENQFDDGKYGRLVWMCFRKFAPIINYNPLLMGASLLFIVVVARQTTAAPQPSSINSSHFCFYQR